MPAAQKKRVMNWSPHSFKPNSEVSKPNSNGSTSACTQLWSCNKCLSDHWYTNYITPTFKLNPPQTSYKFRRVDTVSVHIKPRLLLNMCRSLRTPHQLRDCRPLCTRSPSVRMACQVHTHAKLDQSSRSAHAGTWCGCKMFSSKLTECQKTISTPNIPCTPNSARARSINTSWTKIGRSFHSVTREVGNHAFSSASISIAQLPSQAMEMSKKHKTQVQS